VTPHLVKGTAAVETDFEPNLGDKQIPGRDASPLILVVDDEPLVRQFLTRCLETSGYAVRQAGSAVEALDMMVSTPASMVLCDVNMPGHDGLWLVARLHARWPDIPIVMSTGSDDVVTIRRSRELGAVDFLTKPIVSEQLLEAVRRAMTRPTDESRTSEAPPPPAPPASREDSGGKMEALYTLESPVRCSACGEVMTSVNAVRLIRSQVAFTSLLPRRGRVVVCPHCLAVIPAELTNF
jgi:CheY-like chemotaxis protein